MKRYLKNVEGDLVLIDFKLSDNLKTNMILFCNVLRRIGLTIGPSGTVDALKALNYSYKTLRRDFFWVLASILVKNKDDMSIFERIFGSESVGPRDCIKAPGLYSPPKSCEL